MGKKWERGVIKSERERKEEKSGSGQWWLCNSVD
jgi:hypothetical protein